MNASFSPLVLATSMATVSILVGQEVLVTPTHQWEYLQYNDFLGDPIDPARIDLGFRTTWMNPEPLGYDGPAFQLAPGPYGYRTINGFTIATNVWDPDGSKAAAEPPSGLRHSVYFLTDIIPTQPVSILRFSGFIDDGCIIYLDGVELTRINMLAGPDVWDLTSDGSSDEDVPISEVVEVALSAGRPVKVALSLHNTSGTSSDIGLSLQIESVNRVVPANDDFADAIVLGGPFPITAVGRTDDTVGRRGATKEAGEPDHAGDPGGGSVWWKWTPTTSGRVSVSTVGSSFDTLLGVYTGSAVNAIVPVSRYANFDTPATSAAEPFHFASRVEFDAVAGTTYHIAVDGAGEAFGEVTLTIDSFFTPLDPVAELLPAGSDWQYLLAVDGTNQPIDPVTLDPDFDTTWHTAASYDGPAFSDPAPALLGYGLIDVDPIVTDIWGGRDHTGDSDPDLLPPSGQRYSAYFRTTFTPAEPVQHLGFEGLIDDGAVVRVNGVVATRINFADNKDPENWQSVADATTIAPGLNTERLPQVGFALDINLPANQPVELAVSLHNTSATSSDMGFDLRIYSVNPPLVQDRLKLTLTPTANPGEYALSWPSMPGAVYDLEWSQTANNDWTIIAPDIPADPSGTNSELDQPAAPTSFYRVMQR